MNCELGESKVDQIVKGLVAHWKTVDVAELVPSQFPEATTYVLGDPYAFLVACSFDRGMKAELTWSIPYALNKLLSPLTPEKVNALSIDEIKELITKLPIKPRYTNDAPKTLRDLARLVMKEGQGDATKLWSHNSALRFQRLFSQVHGVGPGIAAMTAILLERLWKVEFTDRAFMDVKPDVHVQRVMFRLGLINEQSESQALMVARELMPICPGDIDSPLWHIGRKWCFASNPRCSDCPMIAVCSQNGI